MSQLILPIASLFDWSMVICAVLVGSFAAVVSIKLFRWAQDQGSAGQTFAIVIASGVTGCGIWSSQLVILAAYRPDLPLSYNVAFLLVSLLIAGILSGTGIAIAVYFPERLRLSGAIIGLAIAGTSLAAFCGLPLENWSNIGVALTAASFGFAILVSCLLAGNGASRWRDASAIGGLMLAVGLQHLAMNSGVEVTLSPSSLIHSLSISRAGLESTVIGTIALVGLGFAFGPSVQGLESNKVAAALDNLSVGMLIFDAEERLLVCNEPYRKMYNVPAEVVRPGDGSLIKLLTYRKGNGTFREDSDAYLTTLRRALATGNSTHREPTLHDGRILSVSTHPMRGGGWVAIHENISDRRHFEEERAELASRDERRRWLEAAIISFRNRINIVLSTVATSAVTMNDAAKSLIATSSRTSESTKSALNSSHTASAGAIQAAAATNELTVSIKAINGQLTRTSATVRNAVDKANEAGSEASSLVLAADKIGDVVKLIQNIASQTNLLALNATIEAARAGDAGRGFAVVASEVKSLSMQTAKATSEIAAQIGAVQASTTNVVGAIRTIAAQINEINDYSNEVAESVTRQDNATKDISVGFHGATEGTKAALAVITQVTDDASATRESADAVLNASSAVENAAVALRLEIEDFLSHVSDKADDREDVRQTKAA